MPAKKRQTKFIFVTGGVVSSIGKGISAASIAAIMEARGLKVTLMKLDPYLNLDPGLMNPLQHGEVFVTDDGAETDLDLGHYERFSSAVMTKNNSVTSGKVYWDVLGRERRGEYRGRTIQVIPHITDEIKRRIALTAEGMDLCIVEVGGTVGDIEGLPLLEAIRQIRLELSRENTLFVHVTYVPYIRTAGELKTKPTQHSVMALREIGIQPDILICRSEKVMPPEVKRKISLFCNVHPDNVIAAIDVPSVYELPLGFIEEGLDSRISEQLQILAKDADMSDWKEIVDRMKRASKEVTVAIVGKYVDLHESYKSLNEALRHGGIANEAKVNIRFIEAGDIEKTSDCSGLLSGVDGILIPGGFGSRGGEGKILAISWARVNKVPFLGICLGLQLALIEFARNICGLQGANSTEFDPDSPYPIVNVPPESRESGEEIPPMRLGAFKCLLDEGSLAHRLYGKKEIEERHRHRYEVSNELLGKLVDAGGLVISGIHTGERAKSAPPLPDGRRGVVDIIELKDHPFFFASMFHPEYKSRPRAPHPLFKGFIKAALNYSEERQRRLVRG
ncbi:MAG: CTP synthase [Deltaproteobacteria bacterium ADurb.Bin058]|nr:MAG: CTP synthase [Deltaproteobacteria bacterium ADurb.Bin058]HQL56319.1 CTP synthase [Myxococcota bacterium]